jgi:hypothetical protein
VAEEAVVFGSLLLIVVAIVLLGYGLVAGSNAAFVASIAASLLAAVALIAGARKAAAARAVQRDEQRERSSAYRGAGRRADVAEERQPVSVGASGVGASGVEAAGSDRGGAEYGGNQYGGGQYGHGDLRERSDETSLFTAVRGDDERASEQQRYRGSGEHAIPSQNVAADVDRGYDDDDDDDDDPPNEPPAQQTSPGDAARVAGMHAEVLVVDGRPRYHKPGCVHLLGRQSEPLPVSEAVELGFTPCSLCEPDSALLAEARRV